VDGLAETTITRGVRYSAPLEHAARNAAPELAHVDFGTLVRTALGVLAGLPRPDAFQAAQTRPGPAPGTGGRPRKDRAAA
jgi:hypothetical protein